MGQGKAERAGKGVGAEGMRLHKIFGTASKLQASWERGLRGPQTTVKMSTGGAQNRTGLPPLLQGLRDGMGLCPPNPTPLSQEARS